MRESEAKRKKGREGAGEKGKERREKKRGREREISSKRVKCVRRDPSALQPH